MNTSQHNSPGSELTTALSAAEAAALPLARSSRPTRASGLRAAAAALRSNAEELCELADVETHLGPVRLGGEIERTAFQLESFARLLEEEPAPSVDEEADPSWPPAPRPSLSRRLIPVGVVAVFSASNFPFAFSVLGGDTASALAAGCPVVVKSHPGHPRLSRRVAQLGAQALEGAGLPWGVLTLVEGYETGKQLVQDDRVDAVAFTGSTRGGRALFDLISARERPIPFYGELGSVNPVVVTREAAEADGAELWTGLTDSFTLGAGQFCTKPGIVFVPRSANAPAAVSEAAASVPAQQMLNASLLEAFSSRVEALRSRPDIETPFAGAISGDTAAPTVLRADAEDFLNDPLGLGGETFGPATLLVEYDSYDQLTAAARCFTGELTGTLRAHEDEEIVPELVEILSFRVGRLLWNQWPTGVSVTAAMQHGGPYPSSTSARDTSVGLSAIQRFQRPIALQNLPEALVPDLARTD